MTPARPQLCMEQILRLSAVRGFPDVATDDGKTAMKAIMATLGTYTPATVESIIDAVLAEYEVDRKKTKFPSTERVCELAAVRFQLTRLSATRNFPDSNTEVGRCIIREMMATMGRLSEPRLIAIVDELLRTSKFFPSIADLLEVDRLLSLDAATREEWRPSTDVCPACHGTGWRRVSDEGAGTSVPCSHKPPSERTDGKARASGEERA